MFFSSEAGRYTRLFPELNSLKTPEGSVKTFWWKEQASRSWGERAASLNDAVADALRSHSYWVWFISDYHGFDGDVLLNLLSRNEAMVSPVVVESRDPFLPEAWTDEAGLVPLLLDEVIGPTSMVEVRGATIDGMLVRRAVFEAMGGPWFRTSETISEDVYFCNRARDLGFQLYIDTSTRLSTVNQATVTPAHRGAKWELSVKVGDDLGFVHPLKHR
jgi:hypothetical protein